MNLYSSIFSSTIVAYVFISMSYGYTQKRAGQRYAEHKQKAPSITIYRHLSKLLFVSNMLLTLCSYWVPSHFFIMLYQSIGLQLLGAVIVLLGCVGLNRSFRLLGEHYSPLFDAYMPQKLVTIDIYRVIRHPIYSFNLCVSFGLALSSGSAIVLLNAIVGLGFVLRAITIEEKYLQKQFPQYAHYSQSTWRLIPKIF